MNGTEYVEAVKSVKTTIRRALRTFGADLMWAYGEEERVEDHVLLELLAHNREELVALIEMRRSVPDVVGQIRVSGIQPEQRSTWERMVAAMRLQRGGTGLD